MNKLKLFIVFLFTTAGILPLAQKGEIDKGNEIIIVFLLVGIVVVGIVLAVFDKKDSSK